MSLLRTTFFRNAPRTLMRSPAVSLSNSTAKRFASQGYGDGSGDPKGENPQEQGVNPKVGMEHPGPAPPKAGQGSGAGPTKGTSSGHNTEATSKGGNSQQQKKSFSTMARRMANQGYGDGSGDPKAEKPNEQGVNPKVDMEHPGPPPPSAGQGTGAGPTKGTSSGHNTEASKGGNSQQKKSFSTMARRMKEDHPKSTKGLEPKLAPKSAPAEKDQSQEVKEHNKQMDKKAEQPAQKEDDSEIEKDKVGKQFW
jgi:hypothetical protein